MKMLPKFIVVLLFITTAMVVTIIASNSIEDRGYSYKDLDISTEADCGIAIQSFYEEPCPRDEQSLGQEHSLREECLLNNEDILHPTRTPQPRITIPDTYHDDAGPWLPIASRYLYYVVIRDVAFNIQYWFDFDFVPPTRAEFVFIGTEDELHEWEAQEGRLPADISLSGAWESDVSLYEDGVLLIVCSDTIYVVIDLYDSDNNRTASLKNWTPYSHLDPEIDDVRFIGTWSQIHAYGIVDLQQLDHRLHALIDFYDLHYVRFSPGGSWRIQDRRDWDFVPPTYVEVETEYFEVEYPTEIQLYMGIIAIIDITFNLLDENRNLLGQYTHQFSLAYGESRQASNFTGTYTIGTLAELGGAGG